jgi:hypothetical protein
LIISARRVLEVGSGLMQSLTREACIVFAIWLAILFFGRQNLGQLDMGVTIYRQRRQFHQLSSKKINMN